MKTKETAEEKELRERKEAYLKNCVFEEQPKEPVKEPEEKTK